MRISLLVLGVLGFAASAVAQAPPRLALADVIADALARNPEIAAAQQRHDAMRQRPVQERSLPDFMVSAGYSSSGRPWPGAGLGSEPTARIGAMVTQQLPYPGKPALRAAIAEREADAYAEDVEAARLSVAARVKQAYYRLAYTYAAADVLDRSRELLDTLLKVSESRYAVGQTAQQDVIKAQAQLTMLELQIERLRAERAAREGELAALMARSPAAAPLGRPADLMLPPFDRSLETLIESARLRAPLLRRDALMIERSALAVAAARKDFKPDFAVSGGYYSMGSMPSMYEFRFDVTVPLRRARRVAAVAEQLSAAEAAKRGYESTRFDLQSRIQQDYQAALSAGKLARLYRDTLLPQSRLALESSITSYQTGAIDFLSVLTSFSSVLEFEMTFYEEVAAFHAALSRLEEMTGGPVNE